MFLDTLRQHLPNMTPGQKRVAAYFSGHLEQASYQTIAQIAAAVQVSETTVVRLSYALGHSSFSDMQRVIRRELLENRDCLPEPESPQPDRYCSILLREINVLQETRKKLDREALERAVELLCTGDRVFLLGTHSAAVACEWFQRPVALARDGVRLVRGLDDLVAVSADSVALAVTCSRYALETIHLARCVKERGGKLILITDSLAAPLAPEADVLLLVPANKSCTGFNSMTAPMAVMELLLAGMLDKLPEFAARLRQSELLHSKFQLINE